MKKEDLLIAFAKELPRNARLLDVGCGTGKAIKRIREIRPDIAMVAMDMEDTGAFLPEGVEFHRAMIDDMKGKLLENSFDAVICQHVIEHLLYPTVLMEEAKKVLKPGGKFFLETPNWTRIFIPFHPNFFWADYTHVRPYAPQTVRRLFSDYGFELQALKTVSSGSMFIRGDSFKKIHTSSIQTEGKATRGRTEGGIMRKIFLRLINPLLKDVLVAVGENKK